MANQAPPIGAPLLDASGRVTTTWAIWFQRNLTDTTIPDSVAEQPVYEAFDSIPGRNALSDSDALSLAMLDAMPTPRRTVASSGGGTTVGAAVIDFGSFPGANSASVVISGQAGITAASQPMAQVIVQAQDPFTAEEVAYLGSILEVFCSTPSAGVGFTITAYSQEKIQGQIPIRWSY